jgi:hypothetical protein
LCPRSKRASPGLCAGGVCSPRASLSVLLRLAHYRFRIQQCQILESVNVTIIYLGTRRTVVRLRVERPWASRCRRRPRRNRAPCQGQDGFWPPCGRKARSPSWRNARCGRGPKHCLERPAGRRCPALFAQGVKRRLNGGEIPASSSKTSRPGPHQQQVLRGEREVRGRSSQSGLK